MDKNVHMVSYNIYFLKVELQSIFTNIKYIYSQKPLKFSLMEPFSLFPLNDDKCANISRFLGTHFET